MTQHPKRGSIGTAETLENQIFLNSPLTLKVEGVRLRGFRDRLRAILGRVPVAQGVTLSECLFIQGEPIPVAFFARLWFCWRILSGAIRSVENGRDTPAIDIVDVGVAEVTTG